VIDTRSAGAAAWATSSHWLGDLVERLDHAGLVVGQHHRDHTDPGRGCRSGVLDEDRRQLIEVELAQVIHADHRTAKMFDRVQDRVVLNC